MENPEFLKQKYSNLHSTKAVESANKAEMSQNPHKKIQNYLDRLEHLVTDPKKEQNRSKISRHFINRPRALNLLREMVMNEYVRPNKEKLAQGAAMVEGRAARQMGIDMHYGEEQLAERGEIAVKDLESSLDQWISYLSDLNEPYPTWFRYYAFRNILDLGEYDKDKQKFPKRTAGTNSLFPDIDRGALAHIQEIIECSKDTTTLEHVRDGQKATEIPEDQLLTVQKAKAFSNMSFAQQYAQSIKEAGEITPEMRAETRGKWIKYSQDSDPTALWASLQNKGTAWCTKGFATAETQLKGGDFYVYYTLDKSGEPKIPRIAIRMQEGTISEARGVADSDQNLEGNMTEIAEKKMNELPGKEKYQKTSRDMKKMTSIYEKSFKEDRKTGEKTYLNPELSKDELVFLYEINDSISYFGYQKDSRIAELRKGRNTEEDMLVVFECTKEEIAHVPNQITKDTKAYVGQLEPGIFQKLPEGLEHVYTSFPDKKIRRESVEIGGKTTEQLIAEMEAAHINISDHAKSMMENHDFIPGKNREEATLIRLTVADLGFKTSATTDQIYERAQTLGLELCPPDTGPNYRLKYKYQPLNEWVRIGMKQITVSDGDPSVFDLGRYGDGLWLYGYWARLGREWFPGGEFVFCLRKSES